MYTVFSKPHGTFKPSPTLDPSLRPCYAPSPATPASRAARWWRRCQLWGPRKNERFNTRLYLPVMIFGSQSPLAIDITFIKPRTIGPINQVS